MALQDLLEVNIGLLSFCLSIILSVFNHNIMQKSANYFCFEICLMFSHTGIEFKVEIDVSISDTHPLAIGTSAIIYYTIDDFR